MWKLYMFLINHIGWFLALHKEVLKKSYKMYDKLFLNGFSVADIIHRRMFSRIGEYVGHGLCYEASALVMLAWHDNPNSRLVYVEAYMEEENEYVSHCQVEVKKYGLWWTIDATWGNGLPVLRCLIKHRFKIRYVRVISHAEFWQMRVAQQFYERLQKPEASYLFHQLVSFRSFYEDDKKLFCETSKMSELLDEEGRRGHPGLIILHPKTPVTQRVLCEFFIDAERTFPRLHTFRKARWILRMIEEEIHKIEEAQAEIEAQAEAP